MKTIEFLHDTRGHRGSRIEIFPFANEKHSLKGGDNARFIVWPKAGLITIPGVQEFSKEELRIWQNGYIEAMRILNAK